MCIVCEPSFTVPSCVCYLKELRISVIPVEFGAVLPPSTVGLCVCVIAVFVKEFVCLFSSRV